ncbi:hypothetical protein PBY51_017259 [Eleginops maclovinus]|uniref:Uncharacterized protein n=1 Tax=Eleginops maclovinus TaxID=56733 RepID=A0AAN7XEK5_ELEMC|nr:hypothetical protein PBY51_017259 [Eleginops maclovinus]
MCTEGISEEGGAGNLTPKKSQRKRRHKCAATAERVSRDSRLCEGSSHTPPPPLPSYTRHLPPPLYLPPSPAPHIPLTTLSSSHFTHSIQLHDHKGHSQAGPDLFQEITEYP